MSTANNNIAELSTEKRELLELLLQEQSGDVNSFPLSFAQQRLWFLDQLEPGNPFYNISTALHLKGHLDIGALAESVNEIVRRHENLRTSFGMAEGELVQVIADEVEVPLPVRDLTSLSGSGQEAEVSRLAAAQGNLPFDLARTPLLRLSLLRLAGDEHVLLCTLHHIISDGWSMGVLVGEVAALYEAFTSGAGSPLPELAVQYADFAVWQREWLQGAVLAEQLSYWRRQLAGAPALLELPADRARPAVQSFAGALHQFSLSGELSAALASLSRREGVTLFMTLLAAFQTLLHRYTNQTDVVVGTPIANRGRTETEALIGFFVNMLVMRTDLSGDPTFRELMARVREVSLGAYAHQDMPFEKLVEELQPERSLSHSPLFQVEFALENQRQESITLTGLDVTELASEWRTSKFDLTLTMKETADGLAGALEYNTDLFDTATISRLAEHFHVLLNSIAANPQLRLSRLSILPRQERQRLLREWNDSARDYPKNICVHHLFEAQVERTPDAVAVRFEGEQLTYRELNLASNRVAHRLQASGVSAETRVGIMMERSTNMVVGLLGILKAGGAYIPLDPTYPIERVSFVLADARVSVLLTQTSLVNLLPSSEIERVCVDDGEETAPEAVENLGIVAAGENVAYVIYTSGSTGQPKGVQIPHRSLGNFLYSMREQPGLTGLDVLLGVTTLSFDIAGLEIYLPLMVGACLELVSREVAGDGRRLAETLERSGATVMQATPASWRMLLEAGWKGDARLKILCGGEALPRELAERLFDKCASLWNLYGPTETTIWSTLQRIEGVEGNVSIGRPIANTQIYILDPQMQPVPVGVAGEAHIGGEGVARGYLNQPDLTADRFIPDPFSDTPGARLYQTGDAARYLPDGRIEYINRLDRQVKLRGFRIELGEIEALLRQHAGVRECAVVIREEAGDKRLVAYTVAEAGAAVSRSELRNYLKAGLPEYMLPSIFVEMAELPLTPNGKIDHRALPAPDVQGGDMNAFVAPRTPVEEMLAGIWSDVLKLDCVGVNENFFRLGGHSLLVTQVISRVRELFNVELPLRSMFEASTLAELAERVEAERQGTQSGQRPLLLPHERGGALPLSFSQQRLWFLHQLAPENSFYNMPAALRMVGSLDHEALEQCLNEIIRRQEALRTSFVSVEGLPRQVIADALAAAFVVIDLSELESAEQDEQVRQLAEAEAKHPFDLAHAPLARARLLKLCDTEHILLFTMHHIISDGWSLGVLVNEVAEIYAAISRGTKASLPELKVQYADYALWQREWLQGAQLEEQLAYWRQQLEELPTLQLPTDHRRPAIPNFAGATHAFTFPKRLSEQVKELSQQNGATLYMTLLAAFKVLLTRYTGQEDIVVGSPIANRTHKAVEGLIGFFINTLVMRTDVSGNPTFRELIGRVREMALNAYAHQDVPFEKLVEELEPERDLSRQPLFQVMFAVQNAPMRPLELPELTLSPVELESTTTRFDLELSMWETEEGRLAGEFRCSTEVFDIATIRRMTGHLEKVLESVVEDAAVTVWGLPLLTEEEGRRLLVEWNDTHHDYAGQPTSVMRWFEQQVERTPDATALITDGAELTYRELNARANQLAHYLRKIGVGTETMVGLYVERSVEMVVGLLGTLKSGGTYVPLNPEYPRYRLAVMIEDAAMPFLLTQQTLLEGLSEHGARVVCLDRDAEMIAGESESNLEVESHADEVAYVVYTSGSAGKPKGVLIEHGNLVHTLLASVETFGFNSSDTTPCLAAVSFDISLFELLNPLLTGGRLLLLTRHQVLDLDALLAHLEGVTTFHAVPSLLRQIVSHIKQQPENEERFGRLRMVFTGGDAVPPDLLEEAQKVFRHAEIKVLYGPTEATIICTQYAVCAGEEVEGHMLGRPLHNVRIRVYDAHRNLVPVGVAGELYLGGGGVGRGYLKGDELTKERFLDIQGERYYRTGDRARYLANGNLEFLGRVDEQVKIRGFRIELGEIETELNSHPMVQEAVAIVGEDEAGEKRLVAYVVQDPLHVQENEPQESQWQEEHLSQWQLLYDETYGGNTEIGVRPAADDEFNLIGWNSSYTGEPIPAPEMREWVENTVARIRTLNPRRVLEIGCGTGLLLLPLARYCGSYRGTDFSGVVLRELEGKVRARGLRQVELLQRRADEFAEAEAGVYDVVVINSVVQYFPSVEYLVRVLEGAVKAVAPGGVIFVGDVRSLPLLEAFHTSIETLHAPASLAKNRLRQQTQKSLASEKELVLDPNFFHALRHHLPEISGVSVELHRGRFHNELTRFRYDVMLRVGGACEETFEGLNTLWTDWTDLNAVVAKLHADRPEVLRIEGVTNARVVADVRRLDLLKALEGPQTVSEIRDALAVEIGDAEAVDPEAWWQLSEAEGYGASLAWSDTGEVGSYDVVLTRDAERRWVACPPIEASTRVKALSSYANNPLRTRWMQDFAHNLVPQLRGYLSERLPDYMLPAVFILLDEIPLTPNGKVDRRALPVPNQLRPDLFGGYVAERTPVEELLAGMWSDLLGIERIGINDNFFDLGGHSLLITQLLSRVRQGFAVELPLRNLFEAPTVAGLAERIEEALRDGAGPRMPPIVPVARDTDLPLSFAQERLWFIDQLDPHSTAYILPAVIRLSGRLNVAAFAQSLDEIVRRHESLRTSFHQVNGQPVQVVAPELHIPLPVSDFSALTEAERETEAKQEAAQEASIPFNLAVGPLVRARLLRLEETEHVLLFTMHHIISDGWSMGVLVKEMVTLYQAFAAGQPSPLPELAVQYADFAVWQREWQRGEVLEIQLDYWKRQLGGELPVLSLPTDRPRPAVHSYCGAQETVALPRILSEELRAFSRSEGVTLFMTLLAAWQTLLHRYSGQGEIVVGSPIANRNRAETEPLIGFFVNTLVMRTDLTGSPTFRDILTRVRETALSAYAHQDLPFEKLVEELQPERDTSHTPIVQIMFALQNAPMADVETLDLTLGYVEGTSGTAKFDLTLSLEETPDGLRGWLEYRTDLFDATTIKRMLGHFENLLRRVVAHPDERVARIPLLAEIESRQLVEQWNDTGTDYPRNRGIHELFEEQAERTPEAVALVFNDGEMSYRELNACANKVARQLQSKGVAPETLVGISMYRSSEMVVALLGILKAGGAYVPFDPTYPQERLAMMLQDSAVKVLVTQERLKETLPPGLDAVVCLDTDWPEISEQKSDNLCATFEGGQQLAYVIYTSGSTGTPKGVAVPHQGVVRLVKQTNYASLTSDSVFLQLAPLSFDASTLEIWGALLNGGRCVLPSEQILTAAELGDAIRHYGANSLWLTSSLFNSIVNEDASALDGVRQLLVGGEALSVSHITRAIEQLPHTQLINGYGPTESTTFTCCFSIGKDLAPTLSSIPIGRPIANTQVYILDEQMQPAPTGVAGELYIGGDGLARGYLSRPELTAEKFIPNPFSPAGGERLYRTGDLTRWLATGEIEFLGRMDHQVKVRGFRIELGEIEAVLRQHGLVKESVVLVSEETGDKRLVAYVVGEEAATVTGNELRSYLQERLPEYMLPSVFMMLDEMPLTPNGKVDRRALPAPDGSQREAATEYVAAGTPVEEMVAGIWCEVLGLERVGVNDNFFELGGHSLLATQLMSRMREAFRVEVPLRVLFESPTVGEMAQGIVTALGSDSNGQSPPVVAVSRERLLPLSFAQQRLWFIEQLGASSTAYNIPFAIRLAGDLDKQALECSLNQIVARHEILRTVFATVEGQPVQVINPPRSVEIPFVDLSEIPNDEREEQLRKLVAEETRRPFDLDQGPMLRVMLLRLAEQEHIAVLTLHHIVSDGWSMGVLVREVAALYEAFTTGTASTLTELPVQYADYAVWQREWLQGEVLDDQLSYWREQLADAPAVLQLPTDRVRPALQSSRGALRSFKLPSGLSAALGALSRREGVTLFMTLLAAWQTLLYRYSGEHDIVVGSPIANRNRTETEALIGFFVNTLAMRTDLSGDPTFRELLARVREVSLEAYAHQDVPFEKLVEEMQPERSLSHSPIFQVVFVLQNAPMPELKFSGLTLSALEFESATTHFDLTLSMEGTPEGLVGWLEYNTDLFDETTIQRILGHFENFLHAVASHPELPIANIEFLADAERQQLLVEHNQTATDYPRRQCIHRAFEEQASETPDAVALVFEDEQLTYRELNSRANQLANYLRKSGVGADSLVGICAERSIELIIGLLGILKAGGAYVPLDPSFPLERVAFIVNDVRPHVLLTLERFARDLPATPAKVMRLDADWATVAAEDTANFDGQAIDSDNLAYVMYTSGSTGTPKGVAVSHGNVLRLVKQTGYAPFAADEVFLQLAPLSFDASTFEIWGALLNGCRLVVMPPQQPSLEELDAALDRHQVTTLWLTSGLFHQFVDFRPKGLTRLRVLLAGGDALSVEHVRRALTGMGAGSMLINGYGPTENTTFTTCHVMRAGDTHFNGSVPIGRPIANTRVYILDEQMQAAPTGVAGELYIGGDGLARGYLSRPELTAEKFIPNPFSPAGGERLYRTGDLTRWLATGEIEFLGRMDHQVKVRGFRIELGEIEAVLRQHGLVKESVVLVSEETGDKRLVAYVVGEEAATVTGNELRSYLQERLPEYMLPSVFMMLDEMPLTPNGKVDRRALPAPDGSQREAATEYVAAGTPVEEMVAGIWCEVLGLERVGVNDNFFELGGHSLLVTQVVTRVRGSLNINLPLRSLFESSTVREFAKNIETEMRGTQGPQAPPVVPVARDRNLPLSFSQERLWFLDQLQPDSAAYNVSTGIRLSGSLDIGALAESVNEIVRRHENLRTSFGMAEGELVQVIADEVEVPLPVRDLTSLSGSGQEAEVSRLAAAQGNLPFDLARTPLLRLSLLRLAGDEHVLLCTLHHIISDGWSMGVLVGEVAALYEAFTSGAGSPLPELAVQYADFAVWQREWLQGAVLAEQLSYWRRQLAGAPALLELPADRARPAVQSFAGALHQFSLSGELSAALASLSRREGVTLFMTLLAAFQTLLHRYTNQTDVVVGTPIANRGRTETEALIGFFVNMLVMRTDLSGDPTFRELMARVREVSLGAYAHQDMPFEKLVEELQPERSLSHSPLFQVEFVLQNAPMPELKLPGLSLNNLSFDVNTTHFDATLIMEESADGLKGWVQYNTELFDAATIRDMFEHFTMLLHSIVSAPDLRVSKLPLLSASERAQLLDDGQGATADYPRELLIHEVFEQQTALTPDRIAVVSGEDQLTYAELNRRADVLAARLRRFGVQAESIVGVMMERSTEMVVSLFGILKAGGAYLPLDPQLPAERLAFMLEDANVQVLLTQERLAAQLPQRAKELKHLVLVDAHETDLTEESHERVESGATAGNLAYIIYTSGSTGQPKAVMVQHRSPLNLLEGLHQAVYAQHSGTELRASVNAPLSFDASMQQLLLLLDGYTLYIIPQEIRADGRALVDYLAQHEIEVFDCTPSQLGILLAAGLLQKGQAKPSLYLVAGEAMDEQMWQTLGQAHDAAFFNIYGPTECTVDTTGTRVADDTATPHIGKPLANTHIHLLDRNGEPVPAGVSGEIHIGGEGLARGYLNRAELTAEQFVPNPFSGERGARLYRTGDLARYTGDGKIKYLGRLDNQVKVRGFRIELGEIEALLSQHASIRESLVVVREEDGAKRIVAYLVTEEAAEVASGELGNYLRARLPDYMVPQAFVTLEAMPLTPNGKVDRRALPFPDTNARETATEYVAARTPVEEMVTGIWNDLLGIERIGVNDNFFELGGHSLLATQVLARFHEMLSVKLPLRVFFETPTIRSLAKGIESALQEEKRLPLPPLTRVEREGARLPLSFTQQHLWLLDQLTPDVSMYNVPAAIRLHGRLDVAALEQSLFEIVKRHEVLRTTFTTAADGQPEQVIHPARPEVMSQIDLGALPELERQYKAREFAIEDAQRRFDLSEGPVWRATLLRLREQEHILLFTMHHIVSDAWSMSVLIKEVVTLYAALSAGATPELPELPIQYADYAAWQRGWLQSETLEEHLSYWREQFAVLPREIELPTDFERPPVQTYRGASQPVKVSKDVAGMLKKLSRREGVTLFMTLLAGFKMLLHRYTAQDDIVVGSPIANRSRSETEDLIGCFINTLALRTDLAGSPTFRELLGRVREVTLDAYAHQDLPFELLVGALQPERKANSTPLFQVWFVLQNTPYTALELPGISISRIDAGGVVAQFDLTMALAETSDGIHGLLIYNRDLFEAETVAEMVKHFVRLLEEVAAQPDLQLFDVPLHADESASFGEASNELMELDPTEDEFVI